MSVEKLDFQKISKEQTPFTVVLNTVIQKIINPLALAIWVYLYSLPQDWSVNKEHLKRKFGLGDRKLKTIFSYLHRANLLEYRQERSIEGKMGSYLIHILCGNSFNPNEPFNKTSATETENSGNLTGAQLTRCLTIAFG